MWKGTVISKGKAKNAKACLKNCTKSSDGCVAINFKKKKCQLLSATKGNKPKNKKGVIAGKCA